MNYTQNEKIKQVTEGTLVVGVDIASEAHYARAFDWRGIEIAKVFRFTNDLEGFESFCRWINTIKAKWNKDKVMIGAEPTGHYWFTLASFVKDIDIQFVLVNPYHVKQCKELDDNSQRKTDLKDPKTIAKLVVDGCYNIPYIPEGVYAELRTAMACRLRLQRSSMQ